MSEPKRFDMVYRGMYGNDLIGDILFVAGRAVDPLLQRHLLLNPPLPRIASVLGLSSSGIIRATRLNRAQTLIYYLAIGSSVKHIYWKFAVCREPIYANTAIAISLLNTALNTCNTLSSNLSTTNLVDFPSWSVRIGTALYIVGILFETIAELQRNSFKNDPENKGKVYTGGLFSIVRHAPYTGYSMWRAGYAFAAGGPLWGFFVLGVFLTDFSRRAIPVMDAYMTKKYGKQWLEVKQKVPYALIPGLW